MLSFGREFLVYFVVVFSTQALGVGFRPGVFPPQYELPRRRGGLGGSLLRPYPLGCVLFLYLLIRSSASGRNKIQSMIKEKKKKKKLRHWIWGTNHLSTIPGD